MTNHPRTNYLYQFTGKIHQKKLATASPQSKYAGQTYYVLSLKLKDQTRKTLQVFRAKLAHDSIWTAIEAGTYSGQYDFFCRNQKGYFYLVNWEPLPNTQSKNYDLN